MGTDSPKDILAFVEGLLPSATEPCLLFEARTPDGHIYRFFANGECEGFPEGTFGWNHALVKFNQIRGMLGKKYGGNHAQEAGI